MQQLVSGRRVWDALTPRIRASSGQRRAAMAFSTATANQLLPLRRGDQIVVNAGPGPVAAGATDPAVLQQWMNRSVDVFSHDGLHAKLVVTDDLAVVGSANASAHAASNSSEAVLVTDAVRVIRDLHAYLDLLIAESEPVGQSFVDAAQRQFGSKRVPVLLPGITTDAPRPGLLGDRPWVIRFIQTEHGLSDAAAKVMKKHSSKHKTPGFRVEGYVTTRGDAGRMAVGDLLLMSQEETDGVAYVWPPAVVRAVEPVPGRREALVLLRVDPNLDPVPLDDLNRVLVAAGQRRLGAPRVLRRPDLVETVLKVFGLP